MTKVIKFPIDEDIVDLSRDLYATLAEIKKGDKVYISLTNNVSEDNMYELLKVSSVPIEGAIMIKSWVTNQEWWTHYSPKEIKQRAFKLIGEFFDDIEDHPHWIVCLE